MKKEIIQRISNLILSFVAILGLLLGLKEITNFNVQDILTITVAFFFIFLISLIISHLKHLENRLNKFDDSFEIWKEINRINNLIENVKKK